MYHDLIQVQECRRRVEYDVLEGTADRQINRLLKLSSHLYMTKFCVLWRT